MSTKLITSNVGERDGTSQPGRASAALAPEYVKVDERSGADLVAFVQAYSRTLRYFDGEDREAGDFSAFLGGLSPAEVAAFLRDPSIFEPREAPRLFRPHVALFLTFLRLYQGAQAELNDFTRRHLDFHFRRFLRMDPRPAVPDRVNLLFTMAERREAVRVPSGTLVRAGVDSIGRERLYRTTSDLVVNRARIERLSSAFVERRLTGILESWHAHENQPEQGRLEMMQIAFGRPLPGDPLPNYPAVRPAGVAGRALPDDDALDALLEDLWRLTTYSRTELDRSLAELRALMVLTEPDPLAAAKREKFEEEIDAVGNERSASYTRPAATNLSFDEYTQTALGAFTVPGQAAPMTLSGYWRALVDVERALGVPVGHLEALAGAPIWSGPEEPLTRAGGLVTFCKQGLGLSLPDLAELMTLAGAVPSSPEGRRARARVDAIGQARSQSYTPPVPSDPSFDTYAQEALGPLAVPGHPAITTLRGYWNAARALAVDFAVPLDFLESLVASTAYSGGSAARAAVTSLVTFSSKTLKRTLGRLRELVTLTGEPTRRRFEEGIDAVAKARRPGYQKPAATALAFDAYADQALGAMTGQKTLRSYWNELREVEHYFGMPIETFEVLVDAIMPDKQPPGDPGATRMTWDEAYAKDAPRVARILEEAHHERLRLDRIDALRELHDTTAKDRYSALLQTALYGEIDPMKGDEYAEELEDALRAHLTATDLASLVEARKAGRLSEVIALLAHAMGLRIGKRPPRKVVWLNMFAAGEASGSIAPRGAPDAGGKLPFSTFGAPTSDPDIEPPPVIGFALSSPILSLSAGRRTITLTFGVRSSGYAFKELQRIFPATFGQVDTVTQGDQRNISPLAIEVSTAAGWRRVKVKPALSRIGASYADLLGAGVTSRWEQKAGAQGMQLVFELGEDEPPLAPLPATPDGMDGRFPALRVVMMPVWDRNEGRYVTRYRELSSLFVGAVHVKVSVAGLVPTALENDTAVLQATKPFEPFGSAPAAGARLFIGHPELVTKRIDRVRLDGAWLDVPANLRDHYKNYSLVAGLTAGTNPTFTSALAFRDVTGRFEVGTANLFEAGALVDVAVSSPLPRDLLADPARQPLARVAAWRRSLQWELRSSFGHTEYPSVSAEQARKLSAKLADSAVTGKQNLDVSPYEVKPPHTPKLSSLTIGYDSSVEVLLFQSRSAERLDRSYHVHPFGVAEIFSETPSDPRRLLPEYDEDSALYVGLSGVNLPETVTLLFQLDEGSADRDVAAPLVTWSQLSGDRFVPLGRDVLSDATRGLQRSGVVELSLGAAEPSTLLPSRLTWVRASVKQDQASICDTRAVHAQAVEAVFEDRDNAPDHHRAPLLAETITKLWTPIAGIASVSQPYPSAGGRPAEDDRTFATRVSERLRHKARALSSWDHERIVLDAFPQIFKAKCIPAAVEEPGRVEVLVIPDVRAVPTNELGPKAPVALLGEIEAHLAARAPACASPRVRNARFRAVRLRMGVRFAEAGNDRYWMGRLNEELCRFLSPWAYDEGADVVIGGRIHASNIVDFVDRRPYVDYLAGITLFYTDDEGERFTFLRPPSAVVSQEPGEAQAGALPAPQGDLAAADEYAVDAGGPDGVLVAFPRHRIDVLTTEQYDARLYQGISYMEIEMDFVVG